MKFRVWYTCMLALSIAKATLINVPSDSSTIQTAINGASDGDTVLIQPGTYIENINYNGKNIVVGSLFLVSGDTAYISQTIIDGNQKRSVILFEGGENSNAVLSGVTIRNGFGQDPSWEAAFPYTAVGGGITCRESSSPTLKNLVLTKNRAVSMGGGIYCDASDPTIINVRIIDNSSYLGGGLYCNSSNPLLNNVTISRNYAASGGGIFSYDSHPMLKGSGITANRAGSFGGGIYFEGNSIPVFNRDKRSNLFLNVAGATGYDLYTPGNVRLSVVVDTFTVSEPRAYHAYPLEKYEFDVVNGRIEQVAADLYVNPSGDNGNNGTSPSEPLRSISYALAKINADSTHPYTIRLAEGLYSPSATGEEFPLYWRSHISISGNDRVTTILDGENKSNIINCYNDNDFLVEKLTLKHGFASEGGALSLRNSNPAIRGVSIINNQASHGGGISCWHHSNPIISDVNIEDNIAGWGGGIYCGLYSILTLDNATIARNTADVGGGGINCWEHSGPVLNGVAIVGNYGGGLYCDDHSGPTLRNVTINNNAGRGTICYNGSSTIMEHVTINENSGGGVTLGGSNATLTNVKICGNKTDTWAGGILFIHSSAVLTNVIIAGNSAYVGGGIYCNDSSPILINVTLTGNLVDPKYIQYQNGGGIFCFDHSSPTLVNTILWKNEPQEIYYSESLPADSNSITVCYSDIQGGRARIETNGRGTVNWLEGNIDADPLFVDPSINDYHLQVGSPCLDAGITFYVWEGDTLINLGRGDYFGIAPNIGALDLGSNTKPVSYSLHQNYPNPFNLTTTIVFELSLSTEASLTVYDLLGHEIVRLLYGPQEAGYLRAVWNGNTSSGLRVPSGIYIARLVTPDYSKSIKMVLVK